MLWEAEMKIRDAFSSLHPLVNFLFFALVIGFSMFLLHPVSLTASLLGSEVDKSAGTGFP